MSIFTIAFLEIYEFLYILIIVFVFKQVYLYLLKGIRTII